MVELNNEMLEWMYGPIKAQPVLCRQYKAKFGNIIVPWICSWKITLLAQIPELREGLEGAIYFNAPCYEGYVSLACRASNKMARFLGQIKTLKLVVGSERVFANRCVFANIVPKDDGLMILTFVADIKSKPVYMVP